MSAAVTTTTSDQANAGSSSIASSTPCATSERTVAPCHASPASRSSRYCARPVTFADRGAPARDVEHGLQEAIGLGISLFDVAADSDSEKLAGDAIRAERARDRVVVATRITLLDERPGVPGRDLLRERLPMPYL